jgi:hypothetical protein
VQSYVIVYGGRQNGKTSLLVQLAAMLSKQTHVCTVDFQAIPKANPGETYAYIAQVVADSVPDAPHAPPSVDSQGLIRYLCEVMRRPGMTHYALLLDELGALPPETRAHLANVLRAMFTGRHTAYRPLARLQVVLSGSIELYDLAVTDVSTLHNICEEMYLADLDRTDAISLIVEGLRNVDMESDRAEQLGQAIYTYVSGHPYLTQRLGGYLLESAANGEQLSPATVHSAVVRILGDNPLLRHLRQAIKEYDLDKALQSLLNGHILFSRLDGEMVQLELLGLAKKNGDYWAVRNTLLARAAQDWISVQRDALINSDSRELLDALREEHICRLQALELQALESQASQPGDQLSLHVLLDIQKLREKICQIDRQLGIDKPAGGGDDASVISSEAHVPGELSVHSSEPEAALVKRDRVFISYSHKDQRWLKRLQVHLKPLEQSGVVTRWDDTMIDAGQNWRDQISQALAAAKVAILLISADFLASDFISTNELPPLLAAAESEGATILPVIISPCRFTQIPHLAQFQAVNQPSQPLITLSKGRQEAIFVKVSETVEKALSDEQVTE